MHSLDLKIGTAYLISWTIYNLYTLMLWSVGFFSFFLPSSSSDRPFPDEHILCICVGGCLCVWCLHVCRGTSEKGKFHREKKYYFGVSLLLFAFMINKW